MRLHRHHHISYTPPPLSLSGGEKVSLKVEEVDTSPFPEKKDKKLFFFAVETNYLMSAAPAITVFFYLPPPP